MVYTMVLEAIAERIESSSLSLRTILKHIKDRVVAVHCTLVHTKVVSVFQYGKEFCLVSSGVERLLYTERVRGSKP